MVSLPIRIESSGDDSEPAGGCGRTCGAGLEKIFPTTAVRFGVMNFIGEFEYQPGTVFKCGAQVVVRTERGTEVGQQVSLSCNGCNKQVTREQIQQYVANSGPEFYRPQSGRILREAGEDDLGLQQRLRTHAREDMRHCAELAADLRLPIRLVESERLLGGERIVFYFSSPERIDFRQLVRRLRFWHHRRIEMRQVGARDEARLVADYEICGRECCCKNFLKKLRPVSMRAAKLQKSTLDPSKVSGRCGRLRCCLRYEHEGYEGLNARLPQRGARVETGFGPATVIDRQVLTQLLLVRVEDGREVTIPLEEVRPATESNAPARKDLGAEGAVESTHQGQPPGRRRRRRRGSRGDS